MQNNLILEEISKIKDRIISGRDSFIRKKNERLFELKDLEIQEIVRKFSFSLMKEECIEFCPMLSKNKTCHEINSEDLNCYTCICPNYNLEVNFDIDKNLYKLGFCSINSKFGTYKLVQTENADPKDFLILSCVSCKVPHNNVFAQKHIEKDLKEIRANL